jgi:hypothetical protein
MIAKNYLKHPEALRFQRELFHNGFKNSPRIMRLMECVFNFAPTTPQWAKDLARKARQLVQAWKRAQITVNFSGPVEAQKTKRLSIRGYVWEGDKLTPFFQALVDIFLLHLVYI